MCYHDAEIDRALGQTIMGADTESKNLRNVETRIDPGDGAHGYNTSSP